MCTKGHCCHHCCSWVLGIRTHFKTLSWGFSWVNSSVRVCHRLTLAGGGGNQAKTSSCLWYWGWSKRKCPKKGRISRVWSPDLMFGRTWSDADEMSLADPAGTCLQVTKSQTLHSALIWSTWRLVRSSQLFLFMHWVHSAQGLIWASGCNVSPGFVQVKFRDCSVPGPDLFQNSYQEKTKAGWETQMSSRIKQVERGKTGQMWGGWGTRWAKGLQKGEVVLGMGWGNWWRAGEPRKGNRELHSSCPVRYQGWGVPVAMLSFTYLSVTHFQLLLRWSRTLKSYFKLHLGFKWAGFEFMIHLKIPQGPKGWEKCYTNIGRNVLGCPVAWEVISLAVGQYG